MPDAIAIPVPSRWGTLLALAFAVGALAADAAGLLAARRSTLARALLELDRPAQALQSAESALRWDPWQPRTVYTRCVALKRLGRWATLAEAAEIGLKWDPDATSLEWLLGEAAFRLDRPGIAAEVLWRAFRHTPVPAHSGAQLWRMALLAGARAWGSDDPRVCAAAVLALRLAEDDPLLSSADRAALRHEATAALAAAGAPAAARSVAETRP